MKGLNVSLGITEIESSLEVSRLARSMHTQVIGATGVGKTESALLPLILSDIAEGNSVIFIDPKGDSEICEHLKNICELFNRSKDFKIIDLFRPKDSATYNPLKIGSPSELKDKIVGSIVWTEEYYKKVSERRLLDVFDFFRDVGITPTIPAVYSVLEAKSTPALDAVLTNESIRKDFKNLCEGLAGCARDIEGLKTDISLWTRSGFGSVLADTSADSVLDWITNKNIIYINLSTLAFEETARRFGRLILQDLKTAIQYIQGLKSAERVPTNVYIDEFSSIAASGFVELLNKARSANVALTLAHQSLGDLQSVSDAFANQIIDNTNIKLIFRLDSPDTSDFFSRMVGTRKTSKTTVRVQDGALSGRVSTGQGSVRESEEFIISPNDLRTLKRGQCVFISKIPYQVNKVKLTPIREWIEVRRQSNQKRRIKWLSL
ncbi:MAG: TraM recognition domain-containing protein [Bdellovibrionia bacterium]